jgi:toxin YoeB
MNIQFSSRGWDDYLHWQHTDKRMLKRINELLNDISRSPHEGVGKPEPLRHALSGYWTRRINDEHRLVYRMEGDAVKVAQAKYHHE